MNQIKIIKLINGDDVVCKLATQWESEKLVLKIDKPLQIKYVSHITPFGLKDYIALIKWAGFTNDHIITIPKDKIMSITNATEEMIKSYNDLSSKYDKINTPKEPKQNMYSSKKLSKDQNDEFNELWDEFRDIEDDDKGTLH